ncbi:MAG: DUF5658 family protein [Thiohalomonadales bacterium]
MSELDRLMPGELNITRIAGEDRRQKGVQTALQSSFRKRRRGPRRDCESAEPHYVDIHTPREFYIVVAAIMLSVLDCFFTLILIQHGSEELNPFMDYFLQIDTTLFFAVKFIITAFSLIFLILHKKFKLFNVFTGYQILLTCLFLYSVLVSYELSMLVLLF